MTQWMELVRAEPCGGCGKKLDPGTTVLQVTLRNVKRKRVRCRDCAEGFTRPSSEVVQPQFKSVSADDVKARFTQVSELAKQFPRQQKPKPQFKPQIVRKRLKWEDTVDYKYKQAGKDLLDDLPRKW